MLTFTSMLHKNASDPPTPSQYSTHCTLPSHSYPNNIIPAEEQQQQRLCFRPMLYSKRTHQPCSEASPCLLQDVDAFMSAVRQHPANASTCKNPFRAVKRIPKVKTAHTWGGPRLTWLWPGLGRGGTWLAGSERTKCSRRKLP